MTAGTNTTKVAAIPAQKLTAMCERNPALGYAWMKRLVDIISKRLIEVWIDPPRGHGRHY
jgi:hypothetical protein